MFQGIRKFFRVTALWVLLFPYVVTFLGAASNQAVLIANHDKFPVLLNGARTVRSAPDPEGLIDPVHCVMTKETHLNFLADIFDFHDGIYSVGDLLLDAGDWLGGFCVFVWIALVIQKLRATNERQTTCGSCTG